MDNLEIQRVLDDLDVQLASGKIDLPTYHALTNKWSTRMSAGSVPVAPSGAAVAPAMAAIKIACPNCGAPPAEDFSPDCPAYSCPYCNFQFTIERAREETEKLKRELQTWLSQMVSGVAAGSSVDASSRAFIFKEKLYPSLQLELNRSVEWLEGFREHP